MIWLGYPAGSHSMSLKAACKSYLGIDMDKSVRGQIIWRKTLTDDIIRYAAKDVEHLEDIMDRQMKILCGRGQKMAVELENKAVLVTAYFEHCGVHLDERRWRAKMEKDEAAMRKAENELCDFVVSMWENDKAKFSPFVAVNRQYSLFDDFGEANAEVGKPVCSVNWNSPAQVIPLLRLLGFDLRAPDKKNGGVKESVDAGIIEKQAGTHPISKVYLRYKEAQKVVGTYGQNFLDLVNPVTHRIHTRFNQIGTDTNRYSSGGGQDDEVIPGKSVPLVNLQNLPADEQTRACFTAESGNRWISADYSGEELRNLAYITINIFTSYLV